MNKKKSFFQKNKEEKRKKKTNKENGFTLLEMLMVIFIIALLLLITIPNITKHKDSVEETSCQGYADMAQTQATAYEIAEGKDIGSINDLVSSGYIPSATCEDGTPLKLNGRGEVTVDIPEKK